MTERRGSLGAVQATALYVGAVLGTGVLVLPAIAAETAGPASLIAWLALIGLSVPMALTYAAMSIQRPDAAGFSDSIERAFGPRWGAASGWLILAAVPPGFPVAMLIAGGSAATAFGLGRDASFVFAAVLMAVVLAVNFAGIRVSATAQSLAVAAIAVVVAIVIGRAAAHIDASAFGPFLPRGAGAVGLAAVQLFWAFVGWEAITPLAAEVRRSSDLWRATIVAVVVVGAFYLALAIVAIGTHAYGTSPGQVALVALAADTFGPRAGTVIGVLAFAITFRSPTPTPLRSHGSPRRSRAAARCRRGSVHSMAAAYRAARSRRSRSSAAARFSSHTSPVSGWRTCSRHPRLRSSRRMCCRWPRRSGCCDRRCVTARPSRSSRASSCCCSRVSTCCGSWQ